MQTFQPLVSAVCMRIACRQLAQSLPVGQPVHGGSCCAVAMHTQGKTAAVHASLY